MFLGTAYKNSTAPTLAGALFVLVSILRGSHMQGFVNFLVGENPITVQIKGCCRRPFVSKDRNNFRANTNRPQEEGTSQSNLKNATSGLEGNAITSKCLPTYRRLSLLR